MFGESKNMQCSVVDQLIYKLDKISIAILHAESIEKIKREVLSVIHDDFENWPKMHLMAVSYNWDIVIYSNNGFYCVYLVHIVNGTPPVQSGIQLVKVRKLL